MPTIKTESEIQTRIKWESSPVAKMTPHGEWVDGPKVVCTFVVVSGEVSLGIKNEDGSDFLVEIPIPALRAALAVATES